MNATGTFEIEHWDESPYADGEHEGGRAKLTRASVQQAFHGDLEGTGRSEGLMAYPVDGVPHFTSIVAITGRLSGRSGSFVVRGSGTYEDGTATETWTVVPGSGTDDLKGLRGTGGYTATHDDIAYHLTYDLDAS